MVVNFDRYENIQYSGIKMSLTTLTIYAKKLAKIIPAYTDMLGYVLSDQVFFM